MIHVYECSRCSGSPIPICMIENLKKGYGGRTSDATMKPIKDPDMLPRITFIGINHLQTNEIVIKKKERKKNRCGALKT